MTTTKYQSWVPSYVVQCLEDCERTKGTARNSEKISFYEKLAQGISIEKMWKDFSERAKNRIRSEENPPYEHIDNTEEKQLSYAMQLAVQAMEEGYFGFGEWEKLASRKAKEKELKEITRLCNELKGKLSRFDIDVSIFELITGKEKEDICKSGICKSGYSRITYVGHRYDESTPLSNDAKIPLRPSSWFSREKGIIPTPPSIGSLLHRYVNALEKYPPYEKRQARSAIKDTHHRNHFIYVAGNKLVLLFGNELNKTIANISSVFFPEVPIESSNIPRYLNEKHGH